MKNLAIYVGETASDKDLAFKSLYELGYIWQSGNHLLDSHSRVENINWLFTDKNRMTVSFASHYSIDNIEDLEDFEIVDMRAFRDSL